LDQTVISTGWVKIGTTPRTILRSTLFNIQICRISRPPRNVTAAPSQVVTFTVFASGDGPLSYQWQKNGTNIAGATSPSYKYTVGSDDNGAQFRCVVTNPNGNVISKIATLTVVDNTPPTANITLPMQGIGYHAGDTIKFAGTGSDAQDGTLPASAFSWTIVFHHRDHTHEFIPSITGVKSGSFVIPNTGETDYVVWYRISLTVKDSKGATYTTFRDVKPYLSTLSFATNPPGLQITLEGQPQTAPFSVISVEGMIRTLDAPSPQTLNGVTYSFGSWSDGGAATHNITTPQNDTSYTANFAQSTNALFSDSFESGDFSKWSIAWTDVGDLSVTSAAALVGSKGMQAVVDDHTPISVVDETPNSEGQYRARFYFDPNSLVMAEGESHVIFFGYSDIVYKTPVLVVELRFFNGSYQVRTALVDNGTLWRYGSWFTISNSVHYLEVQWKAATAPGAGNGILNFWVDNSLRSAITGVDDDIRRIERARLGPTGGIDPGTHGTEYFDAFESNRTSYIGQAAGGPAVVAVAASAPAEIHSWTEEDQSLNPNLAPDQISPTFDQMFLPFLNH